MIPKIENRTYGYHGDNVCCVSATLNIYAGTEIIASTGLSAGYNISQPDFATEITRQLQTQVQAYLGKLAELEALRAARFPTSTDFASAVNQIFDPIQTAIGG
jgi:hypothetical protein